MLWAVSVQVPHWLPCPIGSGDALDAGLLDDTRLGGPVLTSPPPSEPGDVGSGGSIAGANAAATQRKSVVGHPAQDAVQHARSSGVLAVAATSARRPSLNPQVSKPLPAPPRARSRSSRRRCRWSVRSRVMTRAFGIFLDQSNKTALRLKIGEDFQGWKLRSINGREVTMEKDEQGAVLALPQPGRRSDRRCTARSGQYGKAALAARRQM